MDSVDSKDSKQHVRGSSDYREVQLLLPQCFE